jgi:hypothetical protein
MNNKWIIIMLALIGLGLFATKMVYKKEEVNGRTEIGHQDESKVYWTCAMHPQIHSDHAGECPICHMKLVEVKEANQTQSSSNQEETRASVQTTSAQLPLVGIQKTEVEKMTLKMKIPVSGRFLSSSSVAFQIYESDLRYVTPGLTFKGASSFYPDDEVMGVISSVDSIVDPTSRTVRVVGTIRKGPRGTPSETGFRGDIEIELKDRIAIPESSVLHTGSGDLVYVFTKGNELSPRKVALGLKTEGFYDVLQGVSVGETISSGPNFLIDSESKIRGISSPDPNSPNKSSKPSCPKGEHWDIPMSMCMPGEK